MCLIELSPLHDDRTCFGASDQETDYLSFLQRQESSEFVLVTRLTEVRHNLPVEDSFFEKPKN